MWCTAERRFVRHVCLRNPMPFVKSKPPTPFQKLKVPESGSTLHQLIMVAYCLQKIELWYPRCGLEDIDRDLGCLVIATPARQWRIVEIELWATVSLCGLEVGLPAFQLPMFAKCDALPNEICSTCFCFGNPFPLFIFAKTFNSWRHQRVGKGGFLSCESSSNIARVGVWVVNQWWIRIIFRRNFLYPKFVLARSKQLMPVTVKFQIDVLVCGLQGHLFPSFDVRPHVYMESKQKPRSNQELSRFSF